MITKDMLRTDLPEYKDKDGHCNSVLALHSNKIYCDSNPMISRWIVSNVAYYLANPDAFEGWVELEFLTPLQED